MESVLARLAPQVYEAALNPAQWDSVTAAVCRAAGAERGELALSDPERAQPGVLGRHDIPDTLINESIRDGSMTRWVAEKGWISGHTFTSDMVAPGGDFRATSLYTGLAKRWDIHSFCISTLAAIPGRPSLFRFAALTGGTARRPLGEKARTLMTRLSPHFAAAFDMHERLEGVAAGGLAAFETLGLGTLLVDAEGRVLAANASGRRLLERADGLIAPRSRLQCTAPAGTSQLTGLIRATAAQRSAGVEPGPVVVVARATDDHPVIVRVAPLSPQSAASLGARRAVALVFIENPLREVRISARELNLCFGLTPAEARVALAIANGQSPAEIAAEHGCAVKTIRTQMESVFTKAGVRRQSQLVRLLLRTEAALGYEDPSL